MVEIFRTNVCERHQAEFILEQLSSRFPELEFNFDLEDCDRILRVAGHSIIHQLIPVCIVIKNSGFEAELLD